MEGRRANERRGCARTFARPPLRSAVPPMEGKRARADFWRPPLRSAAPPGLVARKSQRKERSRADFCAPSFEERRSPGTGGQKGLREGRGCARTFARSPLRSAVPPGLVARKGQWKERLRARTLACPPLRSAVPRRRKGQWKEEAARADFCAPSFEERRSPGIGGQQGPVERRGCARTFARPFEETLGLAARKGQMEGKAARRLLRALLEERRSPGTGGQEGLMEGKVARGLLRALL